MKGILLINLGTPERPDAPAVRAYLHDFLGDPRVIRTNRILWWGILHGMILPSRPKKSAALYQKIWTDEGSPLEVYTKQQTAALQTRFSDRIVRYAMCYSNPRIPTVLGEMADLGVDDLTIIPLYPQYSSTTTAATFDQVQAYYRNQMHMPALHLVSDFSQNPLYVQAIADRIDATVQTLDPDLILFSYHGIPESYVRDGDPYATRCENSTALILKALKTAPKTQLTYQSRFGRDPWLGPATDETLKQLPAAGVKRVAVIAPSFTSDCLETLYELDMENRMYFEAAGGEHFTMIAPFNNDADFVDVLENIASVY
ncbi:ferrochelatase [Lacticaseibacillus brantae]|uniref:Coproporphyrin III ferrochelatase n=1 Tax=Lacticaseibacillus brantae DSM 23927 TaxID=1423727 RepID=A0A0R2B4W9_9LACO|nr:ferrochelatase [Lacticaseibacillus brantae]KRM72980.1 ferrochelatase [Lacticaseibacillus brantae DSM 23927]